MCCRLSFNTEVTVTSTDNLSSNCHHAAMLKSRAYPRSCCARRHAVSDFDSCCRSSVVGVCYAAHCQRDTDNRLFRALQSRRYVG